MTFFRDIFEKNFKCISLIIELSQNLGNYLKSSWKHILECLSQLDFIQLLSSGRSEFGEKIDIEIKDQQNILSFIDSSKIDRIFAQSTFLNGDSIIELIENLILISK